MVPATSTRVSSDATGDSRGRARLPGGVGSQVQRGEGEHRRRSRCQELFITDTALALREDRVRILAWRVNPAEATGFGVVTASWL